MLEVELWLLMNFGPSGPPAAKKQKIESNFAWSFSHWKGLIRKSFVSVRAFQRGAVAPVTPRNDGDMDPARFAGGHCQFFITGIKKRGSATYRHVFCGPFCTSKRELPCRNQQTSCKHCSKRLGCQNHQPDQRTCIYRGPLEGVAYR